MTDRVCAECGEFRRHEALSLCRNCYARARKRNFVSPPTITSPIIRDCRLPARFWAKVKVVESGCWHWIGFVEKRGGYGRFQVSGQSWSAHRYLYHAIVMTLDSPQGEPGHLQVDHQCHNRDSSCLGGPTCLHRRCVNPGHLRAVTSRVNLLAGKTWAAKNAAVTHCKIGHPLSGDNLYVGKNRKRKCRTCEAKRHADYLVRKLGRPRQIPPGMRTHCPHGHPFSGDNLYVPPGTSRRQCRACKLNQKRNARAKC